MSTLLAMRITGIFAVAPRALIFCRSWRPSMPFMAKSVIIRSGFSSMALRRASPASVSVCTVEKWARACRSISRIMGLSSTSRTLMFVGMIKLSLGRPVQVQRTVTPILAAFAAGLALQHDLANSNALIQGFAHVVDGQRGDAGGDQRLHFHAGLGGGSGARVDLNAILAYLSSHINERQRQGMAHRYQLGGPLGRGNPCNPGHFQGIPFRVSG